MGASVTSQILNKIYFNNITQYMKLERKWKALTSRSEGKDKWKLERVWESFFTGGAKWCCDKWRSISSKSERLPFILFVSFQTWATAVVWALYVAYLAGDASLPAMQLAHSPTEAARWQMPTSWIFTLISPCDGFFFILVKFTYIVFTNPTIRAEYINILEVIGVLVPILGVFCINLTLDSGLLGSRCVLFSNALVARFVLVFSAITAGISMAYFVAFLINLGTYNVRILLTPQLILSKDLLILVPDFIIAGTQLIIILLLSWNEADRVGGYFTMISIGVLAVSMGLALPAALQPCIAAQYSSMAGALVSSGLTLIAIGLQQYYKTTGSSSAAAA
mgnify:CR=1 FL=1